MLKAGNLLKIIRFGVYLAFLTPLVYIPQVIFPAIFGKILYFQIAVELTLPFFACLLIYHKEFRPKLSGITRIILLFFAALFISSFLGVDWSRSFWGYDERMRGIFALLHFLLFYFFVIIAFREGKDRKKLFLFFIIVGVLISLFGVAERISPVLTLDKSGATDTSGHRVMATMGNPIFLAGYMIFVCFLSLYYFLSYADRSRYLALAEFFLGAITVLYTGTRGAFIGLAAGAIVYLFFSIFISGKKYKIAAVGVLSAVVLFLLLVFVVNVQILKSNRFWDFKRLSAISLTEGSARGRLLLWKLSLRAWEERPVLGWGLENFNYAFNKYYDPQFLRSGVAETFADRAHNLFLDWLVMSGAAGLALYLTVWIFIAAKIIKKENFSKPNLALLSLAVAFFGHAFFAVEDPSINLSMFFFFAACQLIFWRGEDPRRNEERGGAAGLGILAILSLVLIYFYNILPLRAGAAYVGYLRTGDVNDKKAQAEKTLNLAEPYADNFRFRFATETFFDAGKNLDPGYIGWALSAAADEIQKAMLRHPGDFAYFHTMGNLYLRMGQREDKKFYDTAINFYKKALVLSPQRQSTMFQLSTAYLLKGDAVTAAGILRQAMAADNLAGQAHWRLGIVLLSQGKKDEAYQAFKESIRLGFMESVEGEMKQAAALCDEYKDYGCAAQIFEHVVQIAPDNADNFAQLAAIYAAAGKYKEAKDAVEQAVSLDPTLEAEAKIFLKMIGY